MQRHTDADHPDVTLHGLADRIDRLEAQIAKEHHGWRGALHLLGPSAGLLAVLIAVPTAVHDLREWWEAVSRSPMVEVAFASGAPILSRYDPKTEEITLSFPISLQNNGKSNDVIVDATASLYAAGRSEPPLLTIMAKDMLLTQNSAGLTLPFGITPQQATSVGMILRSKITKPEISLFEDVNALKLLLEFDGQKRRRYSAPLCFDMSSDVFQQIFAPPYSAQILPVSCEAQQ